MVRLYYSDLTEDFKPVLGLERFSDDPRDVGPALTGDEFTIEDETEIHFGGELNIGPSQVPIFLRAGVFTNPAHPLTFDSSKVNLQFGSDTPQADRDLETSLLSAAFGSLYGTRPRDFQETPVGFTFGGGLALGGRVQLDAAYVTIEQFDEFVFSFAVRF